MKCSAYVALGLDFGTIGTVAVLAQDVEERGLAVGRMPGGTIEEAISLSIGPILSCLLIMGNMQAPHQFSPFVQACDALLTSARAPSGRKQRQQCRQSVWTKEMEEVHVVDPSSGRVLAAAGVMHDPEAVRLGTVGGASQPLDPANLRTLDDVATRIALELL